MQTIKPRLYRLLGRRLYLRLVGQGFFLAYRLGLLRSHPEYRWHYFARRLVREGDHVMDIGANLGYFSVLFAQWVGPEGRVWAVEPVPLYRRLLADHLRGYPQAVIIPFALGPKRRRATMGIPASAPHRHGLTQILGEDDHEQAVHQVVVKVKPAADVFHELDRLDYIKCDVEGYERHVIPQLEPYLRRWGPLVQLELAAENREYLFAFFKDLDYRAACLRDGRLVALEGPASASEGDLLFFPRSRRAELEDRFR